MLEILDLTIQHAVEEYPKESCGLVVLKEGKHEYIKCLNISEIPKEDFLISPKDYILAEESGEIIRVVHSHPNSDPTPKAKDLKSINQGQVPWLIVSPLTKTFTETCPSSYRECLEGRTYTYGLKDCYTIIRDYYYQKLQIILPPFLSRGLEYSPNDSFVTDNFKQAGFKVVDSLEQHDIVLMRCNSKTINHMGVYTHSSILHHCLNRLSGYEEYGNSGYWDKSTEVYVRHVDLF